jgi:RNAse (barnase) inhibitor barstar
MVSDAAKSPFSSLPSHCVRPLGAMSVQALGRWAEETGQHFVEIDLADARDKKAVLRAIGRALEFPAWYGANLDALYDCLTDLPERANRGAWLIVLTHLPNTQQFDDDQCAALLDVFRDAAESFADAGVGLRVLYAA